MKRILFCMLLIVFLLISCNSEERHLHDYKKITIEPACSKDGYDFYSCECGHTYMENYKRCLQHIYSDWILKEGELKKIKKCLLCDFSFFEEDLSYPEIEENYNIEFVWDGINPVSLLIKDKPANDILYSFDASLYHQGYEAATCFRRECYIYVAQAQIGEYQCLYDTKYVYGNYADHHYTDWVVVKEATEIENGYKKRNCLICDKEFEEIIIYEGIVE